MSLRLNISGVTLKRPLWVFVSLGAQNVWHGEWCCCLAERLGSATASAKTLLTRQIAFEPLPASALLAPLLGWFIRLYKVVMRKKMIHCIRIVRGRFEAAL